MTRSQDSDGGLKPRTRIVEKAVRKLERDPPWITYPGIYGSLCYFFYVPTFLLLLIGMTIAVAFFGVVEFFTTGIVGCHRRACAESQGLVTYIMCRALDARQRSNKR